MYDMAALYQAADVQDAIRLRLEHPEAQIIAGGSIDIRGTCRGLVHAGASGDTDSFIIADHLMPTQIRIANLIARSPDHMEMTERAERASIKDGQIVIEPIER